MGLGICRKQHLSRIWYLALRIPAPLGALWQPGVCRKGKYFPTWSLVFGLFILLRCWSRAALSSAFSRQCAAKCSFLPIPVQLTRAGRRFRNLCLADCRGRQACEHPMHQLTEKVTESSCGRSCHTNRPWEGSYPRVFFGHLHLL